MEMEMKKMKTSSEPRDRLSELPDSLIFNVFELLPLRSVVWTQILSHRWKKLWTLTPYLYFYNASASNIDKFRNFVNRFLICWRGTRIQKFLVFGVLDKSLFGDIDLWVRFAVDNGVEELGIHFKDEAAFQINENSYSVSKCLYSCSSLKKLTLLGLTEINENVVQWNRLKSLNIFCFWITQNAIELVLSGCPVLEIFKLSFIDKDNNLSLTFRSHSLKKLSVHKRRKDKHSPDIISMDTKLRICTPNLETLSIFGGTYGNCLLMNVSSLTHATLGFDMNDNMGITLNQIMPTLRHVKGLTLSNCCFQVIGATASMLNLPPLSGVMLLNLNGSFEEHERIVVLLEIFPKLKTLVLLETIGPKNKTKFKPNPSESFLVELRTVKVTWTMRDFSIFPLIKILLKYASKLEKMVFRVKRNVPASDSSNSMFLASQKLLKMPRSSPTAKLILCEY